MKPIVHAQVISCWPGNQYYKMMLFLLMHKTYKILQPVFATRQSRQGHVTVTFGFKPYRGHADLNLTSDPPKYIGVFLSFSSILSQNKIYVCLVSHAEKIVAAFQGMHVKHSFA